MAPLAAFFDQGRVTQNAQVLRRSAEADIVRRRLRRHAR
jgi:hypothetical protein